VVVVLTGLDTEIVAFSPEWGGPIEAKCRPCMVVEFGSIAVARAERGLPSSVDSDWSPESRYAIDEFARERGHDCLADDGAEQCPALADHDDDGWCADYAALYCERCGTRLDEFGAEPTPSPGKDGKR
jgi:hypothetical protein